MRAVRFGSYSMCATLAGTPSLSCRRKSISRYARLCPPPWCRVVMRPELLRPPLLCRGRTSDFSGSSRVTSTKSAWLAPRRPGVVGLYLRIAMSARTNLAEYVDPVAFTKRDDRALDRLARAVTESGPLPFAWPIERVHVGDLDVEHLLDGDLDLRLVRQRVDVERVLVLIQQAVALRRRLLGRSLLGGSLLDRLGGRFFSNLRGLCLDLDRRLRLRARCSTLGRLAGCRTAQERLER